MALNIELIFSNSSKYRTTNLRHLCQNICNLLPEVLNKQESFSKFNGKQINGLLKNSDRLYYIAETNNMLSWFQASFCKGQSCEDQITWIVQAIEDRFQQRLMKRSVLTLLDFSKVYDTVWREKLLLHMLNTGLPPTFIHWTRSFLNDRRGSVQLFNIFSSSRRFTQGLPQGSFLAHLLFLFYINDLTYTLNNDAVIALFADDVSILTTAHKKEILKLLPSQ